VSRSYIQELLKGVIEPLLLFIIGELPVHGYQIEKELEKRSQGYFKLATSTVYSALRRLEHRGLIFSSWEQVAHRQRRRCYELTEKGRRILSEELAQWQKFHGATDKVMSSS
jgi:PadR family transcriptional regulator PadR